MTDPLLQASVQDGRYPRPQLLRPHWADLTGTWAFAFDDGDEGLTLDWPHRPEAITGTITVPFPPESEASGVHDQGYHRVLWYHRTVSADEIAAAGHAPGRRLMLHLGAVDYRADVWIDGSHLAHHEGGHTPFSVGLPGDGPFELVVRAEDDPHDLAQPRGKQDWEREPHVIWYPRTSGIWQPVWLESVPPQRIVRLAWQPNTARAEVAVTLDLAAPPAPGTRARIRLSLDGELLAEHTALLTRTDSVVRISVDALRNGQALGDHLWSPERPILIDADVELTAPGHEPDRVASYLGFRDVGEADGRFLLNGLPHVVRGVLSQGYWPISHLAAPDADALRAEVELIKELGFTTVRVHQKIEDPRFLYWADRLGLLVWEEMPSAYEFTDVSASRLVREWLEVVRRDSSHPSVVAWVPLNESWGAQQIARDERQQALSRTLYHLTKTLDETRLVISNDGWEHTRSDLLTVHDYQNDPVRLHASYATAGDAGRSLAGTAPNGRQTFVGTTEETDATGARPVILSEFGGVSVRQCEPGSWGYRLVSSNDDLERHLTALFAAVHGSEGLAGWCYTQLTDTAQETNGLADARRVPKLPAERIRVIVQGSSDRRPDEPELDG
ncbi:MAG: glycoside hydrolase family 2 [Leifsonia xyli]|nr:MAG: glycoside hydrolase family 2 [Leifsonia xyli]